jgi:hypothetical protein
MYLTLIAYSVYYIGMACKKNDALPESNGNGLKANGHTNGNGSCKAHSSAVPAGLTANGNSHEIKAKISARADITEQKKKLVLDMLAAGAHNMVDVCKQVDITGDTYYRWLREDDAFCKAVDKYKEMRVRIAEDVLFRLVCSGDLGATIFFLCNRAPQTWQQTNNIKGGFDGKLDIKIEHVGAKPQ